MWRAFASCILGIAVVPLCAPLAAQAQTTAKVYRVGWLGSGSSASATASARDFQQGLGDLGYVIGRNVVIDYRYADGDSAGLAEMANGLAQSPVDVIVTSGETAALAAKRATKSVPIVAIEFGLDPVKAGLVTSLGRPEANVTGLASISEDLWQKRLALLKEVAPRVTRAAALWNPANPGNAICVEELRAAAPALGVQLRPLEVRDAKTLEQAFAIMAREPTDAVAICWDSVTLAHAKAIADFALAHRMATVAPLKEYAQAGALLSFGASLPAQRRRAAYYVNKILKGAKAADLPVERPTLFELVVNMRTAKALGIALPAGIALLADDLLE